MQDIHVTRDRLYKQVAEQIQNIIIQGALLPGDKLPPERQLAEQLGVSRTVIREAIKALHERGLVSTLTGSGSYVSKVPSEVVTQSLNLFLKGNKLAFRDLIEVRRPLEVESAGLAAERATENDIQTLESTLVSMKKTAPLPGNRTADLVRYVQADVLFHQTLARASHNVLMSVLLMPITDLMTEFISRAALLTWAPDTGIGFHQKILDCVRNHGVIQAQQLMREHMDSSQEMAQALEHPEHNGT